jgi:hypothetical protein
MVMSCARWHQDDQSSLIITSICDMKFNRGTQNESTNPYDTIKTCSFRTSSSTSIIMNYEEPNSSICKAKLQKSAPWNK